MEKEKITKIFNRQIGKVLTFLDEANASPLAKTIVRKQLWLCHDDIQALLVKSEEKEIDGNTIK